MPTIIRHNLLNIPVMLVNFVNSRAYDSNPLHQFSRCHKARVRYKKVCEECEKEIREKVYNINIWNELKDKEKLIIINSLLEGLRNPDILKGTDKEHILTQEQQERLKEALDNQTIEILSFEQEQEIPLTLIQGSKLILPSISKGFKMRDVEIFFSFKEALKELGAIAKVKYTTRGKEHLGILKIHKDELIFIELPFFSRLNIDEITRLKQAVEDLRAGPKLKDYAVQYIKANLKPLEFETIQEKKAILIKKYLEQAIKGERLEVKDEGVENPFIVEK